MLKKTLAYFTSLTVCLALCLLTSGCDTGNKHKAEQPAQSETPQAASPSKKWHEGGTLHKATALEWQTATYADKLATCADFIARMHNNKHLKKELSFKIKSIDDMRPLAEELVVGLDKTFEKSPNSSEDEQTLATQKLTSATVMFAASKGWINY